MSDSSKRAGSFSREKSELFELLLKKKQIDLPKSQTIPRRTGADPSQLSFAQQRLWFLDQLESGSPLYNIPAAVRLTGHLNMAALEQSFNEIVRRHEALRTRFAVVDGSPVQVIAPTLSVPLPVIDLSGLPEAERAAEARRLTTAEVQRPFDLARGPVFRAGLLRLNDEEHVLHITMHHIISDGWSIGVFMRELTALYEAFSQGQPSPFAELPIQYADYAIWQREWLTGEVLDEQLAYWKEQLSGSLPELELPTDRSRPAVQSYRGATQRATLSKELTEQLRALSQREGVTLFMTLLAAFQTLLMRYSGQEDIVVGSPIANRNRIETEALIGFFVNTLVLRTELSGNPSFRELMGRVKEVAFGAYAHQDLPFEKVVEELQPERTLSQNPLFQVVFQLMNAPQSALKLSGLTLGSQGGTESGTAKFDLSLFMFERAEGEGLSCLLEYSTDLFDAARIERTLGHFQVLLEGIVANPNQRLSELPLLSEAESHQLLVEWNDTATDRPTDKCVHELFEAQVECMPGATAVMFEDQRLSYRELNERANQVAHYLRKLGVGPEVRVGICMERSVEMVVALLGILKAGGAYVPLDPAYPKERLAFMLGDTQAPVLLTQVGLVESLPKSEAEVVCLDTDWKMIAQESAQNPISAARAENLVYVIYTSGSTGKPKGVAMTHGVLANLLWWQLQGSTLPVGARTLQFASLSFDVHFQELFSTWCAGGTLVLISEELRREPAGLLRLLREATVERLFLPFVALQQLSQVSDEEAVPGRLREVITAGEQLQVTRQMVNLFSQLPGCRLENQYGPSESHVVTSFKLTGSPSSWAVLPPIGRPIANAEVYILDRYLNPVPVGVPGELYIGGDGLARGYLNRPDLTAERFIPNLFSRKPGARLYKTGDLVRYLVDGNIEFLGRLDGQVKIRGFRIELGEIEWVLTEHQGVREAAAVVREDVPGDKRLVAYVVASEEQRPGAGELPRELRSHLKEKLPEYMVPSAFVMLDELPLTPSGKVDRRALPVPDQARSELEVSFVPPRNPIEELVSDIWGEVLKVEQVGIYDNFFDLGGHSLLATQVISRLRRVLQVELPLRSLFEEPTVAGWAARFELARRADEGLQAPPIMPVSRDGNLPLSFAQQRLWFLDQLEPNSSLYNMPQALRLSGPLDTQALRETLTEIAARHEALRTSFTMTDGDPVQVIAPAMSVELPVVELSELPEGEREAEARRLTTSEAQRPFDLARGPLFRAGLLRLNDEDHVLHITMHHIISDGWSIGVFTRELTALYEAFSQGQPSPLAELPIQYADYAIWQREWLAGEQLERQLSYWRKQLGSSLPELELPTDRSRPAVQSYRGATQRATLSKELTEQLRALSQREGVTLFMTLLAAFQTLLMRYSGQEDIVVGSPIANRNRIETEALIGFFVNTLVLRTELSGNPSFRELMGRVKEVAFGAYAHQDLPFEKVVEELQPERTLSQNPLFQVVFQLMNAPQSALKLSGLTLGSQGGTESGTAKFDLSLFMFERAEGEGLSCLLEYSTDLFDAARIERTLGHFQVLLEGIVANPNQRLSELPLLSEAESHQLLVEWNDTATDRPTDKCVHELFEAQVECMPDATAVMFEDQRLSYRELNERANQVAHYLRKLGVGPEVRVGICMERSVEMVVALLGILKAGGAYVPLDPAYPKERLAFMLGDTQAPVLLTQVGLVESLPKSEAEVVCLDTDWKMIAQESAQNPISAARAENLVYVIYTSGSTGKPKGVAMTHGVLANLLWWQLQGSTLPVGARTLQFASLSFDVHFQELFSTWCAGGTLVLISEELRREPAGLLRLLREATVERLFLPFVALQQLSQVSDEEAVPGRLREVITAGEQLQVTRQMVNLFSQLPGCRLENQYGPSESHVVTSFKLTGSPSSWAVLPPIGRPIANAEVYILDRYLNPVPVGVPGELYIGGDGLARGYLNRPDLTAERFIPNLFSRKPGARLYKTGDLVRYLVDGNIEFLGRLDGQVKIRGFRIELGEIEWVLTEHQGVREAAAVVREDVPGDKRLVAYVVASEEQRPGAGELPRELRSHLKEKLPEYMVPSAFVMLDELPLTPSGKVDRRALPVPDQARSELEVSFVPPRNPIEELVSDIWGEVLKVEQVGIYDNFFDLGGHSLLATQVISRLRRVLQVELPLRSLFEEPTVAGWAARFELARRADEGLQAPPIMPVSRDGNLPLSFAQQRLWFLDQLEPNSSLYNMPQALRLSGPLDTQALRETLTEIAARHEALRTSFTMTDGDPVQVIAPAMSVELPVVELSELPEGEREAEARRLAKEEARRPFDLARGPLLRATLLRLGEEEHVLLLNMHHIVSDGWSLGVLFRELGQLYKAFSTGKPSPLPKLPIQYADYAVWQREWLAGERLEQQLSYWKEQLSGAPPILSLPADHPRPAAQSYRGARQPLRLSKEVAEQLKAFGQREGATLFMTLLAAFQTLLMRYTGQEDIVVGSAIAGRVRAEVEGLIGFFVNTLVLRTDLSGDPSFRELLGRVREVTLGAYEHQDVPFEKLVEELQPERSLSHTPLFQVLFTLQNAPTSSLELSGLTLGGMSFDSQMPVRSDIDVFLSEASGEIVGYFAYNTDLFDASTVARMLCHFHILLEGIIADPDRRLSKLPLLTEAERQLLLVEWNDTATQYPRDNTVHQLFEAQVERTPDAVAVVCEDQWLTYRELNGRANQVAHYLRRRGVAPEVLVGIMMERSPEMVVGLLGILKAGGAYVPLDPAYPQERLAFMLEDTQSPVLLTQSKLVESVPQSEAQVVCIEREWSEIAGEGRENPSSEATAENVAYVIYTSGSTGKPKGAMILHRGVVNYLSWCTKSYAVADGGGAPVHSPLGFDLTVTSLFSPLLVGQRVVLVREETGVEAVEALGAALRHEGPFSLVKLTPSHLELLSQSLPTTEDAGRTRALIIGGEALTGESLVFWQEHAPETRLINEYGPTETVVGCCVYELAGGQRLAGAVPIGRPIANTHLYVLDAYLNPVPVGVTGELFVGGDGLARGYLNRPELTAERFIADPFATGPGARLYRTGDLARYLPDGNLEFLGRLDNQVKVRGYRIELGEIEVVLNQHPTVRETVVVVRGEGGGDKRLVAYLVACEGSAALNTSELRSYLRGRLPEYMVPQSFALLNEMPLTSNGKVDRRALPEHDGGRPAMDAEYVGPRTGVEEEMARIWVEVLGVKQVGVYDNFFELGGHSLLATRVVSRVRKNMEVELPLRAIFEEPTVAGLAVAVTERRGGRQDSPIVKMERANRGNAGQLLEMLDQLSDEEVNSLLGDVLAGKGDSRVSTTENNLDLSLDEKRALLAQLLQEKVSQSNTFPVSFAQQRLWFLDQLEPGSPFYSIPQAIRMSGALNPQALQESLDTIVARHESLRTTFRMANESPVQVVAPCLSIPLPVTDLSGLSEAKREAEARRLAAEEARQPFDLEYGPLMRSSLLRLQADEHVLLLNMHHIVSDAWSMGVFVRELTALYEEFSQGRPSPLPELPIQYADFAVWQREWLAGDVLERQLSYWKKQLIGAPAVLELPTDRPRPAVQSHRGAHRSMALSPEVTDKLKELSRREGATLFMTLLAAFQVLLMRYTRQEDIVVGSPIAGRNRDETENLIGFFVNTLVLRTDLSGDPTFRELLGRVKEVTFGAYEHQDLPFEKLVEELQPERSMSHTPLFQVMFSLLNTPGQNLQLPGLKMLPLPADSGTSQFDVALAMVDGEEGLWGSFTYSMDLFDRTTVTRMVGHFQTLLEGIAANPDQHLSALPILTEAERQQLLVEWNDIQADYPRAKCIHELFEAQAERTPEAVAVVFEGKQLSYRELNRRANLLAHHLQKFGVGPEGRVGIMVERSFEMVVGLLGILKAGGAYVPLDPAYPQERLSFMLEDAQVAVLLTQKRLAGNLPPNEAKVVRLDADWEVIARGGAENPVSGAGPENLAYVIYTSGSTGRPKGVLVTHHNVVRLFKATEAWFNFDEHDVWTLFHSYAFDFSVWELWGALAYGGRLVLVPYLVSRSPEAFYDLLRRERVTVLNQTPSAFYQLMQAEESAGAVHKLALRYVIFGGEALELKSLRPWFERHGDERPQLVNMYGITETTVHVTYRPLTLADVESAAGSVIGRRIPDLQVYALDRHLQPVPVGVPGELYIGGEGVARGYLNRAELTDERFVADPFSGKTQGRLYKSGDLGRYWPDGDIEYLGRIDQQVKIRGFRIELGEIEVALLQHPAIEQVVVVAREDEPGDKRLVAYVVAQEGPAPTVSELISRMKGKVPLHLMADADVQKAPLPDVSELRGFLKEKLPEYMVPSAFVMLHELPLTPNGKVDRRALPVPDQARPELERAFLAPRDTLELQLTKMWEKVLGVEPIGIKDNFFDLGGHSLLAVRLFAQIEKSFGRNLPLATLFQAPTIEQLADVLRQQGWTSRWSSLVPIQPGGSKPPLYCMHAGGGQVFFYRDLAHRLGPDQPFYGLQIRTLNGVQMPHTTFEEMAAHYIEEIRTLQPEGPYYLGGASSGGTVAFEMAQQLHAQGQKVALVAMFDTNGPGYPKLLPGVTVRRHKVNSLKQRIEHHLGSLKMLESKNKLGYLTQKAKKLPKMIKQNIKNKYRKIAPKFYLALGRPLPQALRKNHNVILKAYLDYKPQVYPGRVTLFRAKTQLLGIYRDPTMGWDGLAAEGLEIHELPGFHGAMVAEPRVRFLAEKLTDCLAKARAAELRERI